MKIMAILAILASLLGCGKHDPYILDGPCMEYVDSEYRTEYANCLPFEDIQGSPYLAIAYLGKGEDGKANKDVYINKIFESLDSEKISQIKTFEFEGDDWFLVIPKYRNLVSLKKGDEELTQAAYTGEAFALRCGQDVIVNIFETKEINYLLSASGSGELGGTDENVWDITNIDEILKQ
jgi:hypothetical protein